MDTRFIDSLPKEIFSGNFSCGHVQGIAVDAERKYIYYSYTTQLVKADLSGNIIGTVTGLAGHLGCISYCKRDGRIYGSLEYKRDVIGKVIAKNSGLDFTGDDAFYIAIFDPDKIVKIGHDSEKDGIMTAVYLSEVAKDFSETDETDGEPHRYGCSGIDGVSFGPEFGTAKDSEKKEILCVAYGIYGDINRKTNDHQVLLAYDSSELVKYEQSLSQQNPHKSGPDHIAKYFLYTGNTVYGIQNLEYDANLREWLVSVYVGKKPDFPNFPLFAVDGTVAPELKKLVGRGGEEGLVLSLKKAGDFHEKSGVWGYTFPKGQTGLYSFGNGYFYISHEGRTPEGHWNTTIKLCKRIPDDKKGFEIV